MSGSTLSSTGDVGTSCGVTATKAGDTNYNSVSSSEQTVNVNTKANQAALSISSSASKTLDLISRCRRRVGRDWCGVVFGVDCGNGGVFGVGVDSVVDR